MAHTALVTVVNPGKKTSNVVYFPIQEQTQKVSFAQKSLPAGGVVAVGDFNNDGILDIAMGVTISYNTGAIEIYLGKGDGSFRKPVVTAVDFGIVSIQAADFNGDGNLDVAAASGGDTGNVIFFLGDGKGGMKQASGYGICCSLLYAIADFNGDGNLDVISWPRMSISATATALLGQDFSLTTGRVSVPLRSGILTATDSSIWPA